MHFVEVGKSLCLAQLDLQEASTEAGLSVTVLSEDLDLLVQTLLLYACCFTEKTG